MAATFRPFGRVERRRRWALGAGRGWVEVRGVKRTVGRGEESRVAVGEQKDGEVRLTTGTIAVGRVVVEGEAEGPAMAGRLSFR